MATIIVTTASATDVDDDSMIAFNAMSEIDQEHTLRAMFREAAAMNSFGIISHEVEED